MKIIMNLYENVLTEEWSFFVVLVFKNFNFLINFETANPKLEVLVESISFRCQIQGPPKNLPRPIYPISSIVHPNQTLV